MTVTVSKLYYNPLSKDRCGMGSGRSYGWSGGSGWGTGQGLEHAFGGSMTLTYGAGYAWIASPEGVQKFMEVL